MKIGINASYAVTETPTGIGNYIIQLLRAFKKLSSSHEIFLYYRSKIKKEKYLDLGFPSIKFEPPFSLFDNRMDVFHDPSHKYIKVGKSKNVITVHDIVVALKEDYTSEHFKKTQTPKLLKALKKADRIITVSEFTKSELIKYFSLEPEKMTTVYHGVDLDIFKPGAKNKEFLKRYNLPEKYLLFVGNIEKRKNLFNMIKSFEQISSEKKDLRLVLTGKNGYGGEEIRQFIRQSKVSDRIIQIDYIYNNELPLFYQNAELFFFPSCYEGFGIPVLESMACECPVLTSDAASMPEAGGDAVVYCDPFNIENITEKTLQLLNDKKLKQSLLIKAREHIKKFTWENTAKKTMEVYESLVS